MNYCMKKETLVEAAKNLIKYNYSEAYCESALYARFGALYGIKTIKRVLTEQKNK